MNRISAIALIAASTLAAAGNASAQSHSLRATIPFDFTLNSRVLPAGEYDITESSEHMITVQNRENRGNVVMTSSFAGEKKADEPVLLFHKYGQTYFLAALAGTPWSAMNVSIPRSKQEQRALRQEAAIRRNGEVQIALK